ncbi:hypothetical protein DSCO28_73260 (plasmid) [Desulfosarcina ovata subsp. sediminis]|uniref:Conjugal transfer protein TrbC n=1 Tax=Desulfosarcina ovata subsp. sediminis TaxID=885957 RepID=A0A5K8A369_9BACT|nr:hypothetical protein [Desulfosarcina ovata]BBO86760.1 hypothetical protein DSCO28_73260 [Desulfosarcina ovata subsp. sediminis]
MVFQKKAMAMAMFFVISIVLAGAFVPQPAFSEGFGDIGERVGDQSEGMAAGVKKIGFLAGIALVTMGVAGFATMKKTNISATIPSMACIAGIVLLSIFAFISAGSETLFGSDEATGIEELELK